MRKPAVVRGDFYHACERLAIWAFVLSPLRDPGGAARGRKCPSPRNGFRCYSSNRGGTQGGGQRQGVEKLPELNRVWQSRNARVDQGLGFIRFKSEGSSLPNASLACLRTNS